MEETYIYDLYDKDGNIYLFGIDRKGNNTIVRVENFKPWFVVELPQVSTARLSSRVDETHSLELLQSRVNKKNQEIVMKAINGICRRKGWEVQFGGKHMGHLYYANRPHSHCLIVTMDSSQYFRYLRKVIEGTEPHKYAESKYQVHELRTPSILQFGCKAGIDMCGWIQFVGTMEKQEGRKTFWKCSASNIRRHDTTDGSPTPTVLYYDIESYTANLKRFPRPELESDVMFQVSVVITGYTSKSYLLTLGKPQKSKAYKTLYYETESDLIEGFCKLIRRHDPNLITGYNIHGFDWRYIFVRAMRHGPLFERVVKLINMLGWDDLPDKPFRRGEDGRGVDDVLGEKKGVHVVKWSTAQMGSQKFIYPAMPGRISFDLLPYVRREFSKDFRRYKLDIVAGKLLGAGKDPITPADIHHSWRKAMEGDYGLLTEVGKYCVKDSELVRDLFSYLDIWTMLTQSSIVMNITAKDLYIKGQQIRIYCQVYRYCYEHTIVIDESAYIPPQNDTKYEGACVLVPQPGMYSNVVPFDFCLTGDTRISLLNGTSVRLDQIQGGEIVSSCVEGHIGANRVVGRLQQKGVRDTVKVCLSDGTEIISTPDHKFMLEDGSWCEAQNLHNHCVKVGMDYPLDIRGGDEVGWSLKLADVTFTMTDDRDKVLAFSRLLGLVLSDGSIYMSRSRCVSEFSLGTEYDSRRVMDDIELICGKRTTIAYRESSKLKGSTFRITPPAMLSKMFHSLDGIVVGKRVTQPMRLPSFLTEKSCPKSVIREFLGGLFGGDGVAPCLATKTMSVVGTVSFKWATLSRYTDSMKRVFRQINDMLEMFGIMCTMASPSVVKYHSHPPADLAQNPRVNHLLRIPQKCIERFSSRIGFRYCINKTAKLDIITRYLKFCRHVREQNGWVVDRTNQLISEKIPNPFSRSKKYPSFQECLDIARSELKQREVVLHEYSLSSIKDLCYQRGEAIRHADKPRRVSLSYKKNFPTLDDFITQLGVEDWFSIGKTKKYAVSRTRLTVPSYSMKVVAIRDHTPQPVYDIEVASSHNFLANGAVAHNCSLYPTIIVAYNICYSTLVRDETVPDNECHVIEWDDENGEHHHHRFIKQPMGVIPTIIQNLLKSRSDTKKELKHAKKMVKTETDPEQRKEWEARASVLNKRQLSFKISANSMYGGMGVKKGYLPCREAASSVTAKGRQELMNAKRILETHFDARVIYGDSVLGDTPILVKYRDGMTDIQAIETLGELWEPYEEFKLEDSNRRDKHQSKVEGLQCWTSKGWSPVVRVIKHKTCKRIYRVNTHCGVVDVTEDHSLLTSTGEKIKPQDCVVGETRLLTGLPPVEEPWVYDYRTYTFPSKIEAARFCYEAREAGCEYSVYVSDDGLYELSFDSSVSDTSPEDYDVVKKCEVIHEAYTDYVYDIETVTGNFQAGIGDIILKNTDSCYVVFDDYKGDDLYGHSKAIDAKINRNNKFFPWPMELEFEEEVYRQFLILKKKCYMWRTADSDDVGKKGGMLVRRDVSHFEQMVYENVVNMIFDRSTVTDVTCYVVDEFNKCCGGGYPSNLFTISSSVKDVSEYKLRALPEDDEKRQARLKKLGCDEDGYKLRALPRQVQLAERMKQRGTPVGAGERIEYLLTTQADRKAIQADRIEEYEYFTKNRGLIDIDYTVYIDRISNNLDELIDVVFKIRPLKLLEKRSTKVLWTMKRKNEILVEMCSRQFKLRVHWNKVVEELKSYFQPVMVFECGRHHELYELGKQCGKCSLS